MSIIAVKGIPAPYSLLDVVKCVGKLVGGPFEPLNFTNAKQNVKTCYLRLSERLDPVRVVERISSARIGPKALKFTAYVPENVPDLPLPGKRKKIPMKLRDKLQIPELELPHEVIINTHHELFLEIQYKYPGLYNLSRKTSHKLLNDIARIIGDRLKNLMDTNADTRESSFLLSKCYRRAHPHFGDFQLILSTLHRAQDAAGAPRAQIQDSDLLTASPLPHMIDNVPIDKIKSVADKYSNRFIAAMTTHVNDLNSYIKRDDTEEEIAKKKIREELKKLMPLLPAAIKQVIQGHFVPEEPPHRRIRIYGEPFLPAREAMAPFTRRYAATGARIVRSRRMYNLLMFRVPTHSYAPLRAMDATVINGAKLTIRTDIPVHQVAESLRVELAAHYGGTPRRHAPETEDEDDEQD